MSKTTVTITEIARGGSGLARMENGQVVFVPYTAPGDVVEIEITKNQKNYAEGKVLQMVQASAVRVKPPCAVFEKCGGCSWQHLPYSLQFETKKKGLLHAMKRVGHDIDNIEIDELPAKNPFHYRNRIQLRGDPKKKHLGFYQKGSLNIIDINRCEIADQRINHALKDLKKGAFEKFNRGFKLEIDLSPEGALRTAWNRQHAAFGFRQVNDEQNSVLQDWVRTHALGSDYLLDLFGGSGNLSRSLSESFKEIHCVDSFIAREAIEDPNKPGHYSYHKADVTTWLKENVSLGSRLKNPIVILDPPREGLGSGFKELESLLTQNFSPERILLIGCDVDAFCRDSYRFVGRGYQIQRVGILDLFPQTPHVESLAVLTKPRSL